MDYEEAVRFNLFAPGKVILFGEHSVVYGKTAVAGSVNLKTKLSFSTASFSSAKDISLHLPNLGVHIALDLKKLCKKLLSAPLPLPINMPQNTFCFENPEKIVFKKLLANVQEFIKNYVQVPLTNEQESAVASFLCILTGMFSTINIPLVSCFIEVTSQIPIGAGMGSSTAYNVCLAAAFLNYIRIQAKRNPESLENMSRKEYRPFKCWDIDTSKFCDDEFDLISRWALIGDKVMHGNPSGIDNAVCTYGRVVEFKKGERNNTLKMVPDPKYLKLLLVNTKVPRNTKELVDFVSSRRDRFYTVIDPILESMDSLAITAAEVLRRMGQLTCVCDYEGSPQVETISDEVEKLEELVDINQKLLESLGVSHPSLENICRLARDSGLHAKLTGAGGGGFSFIIIPHRKKESATEDLIEQLKFEGYVVYEVVLGGPGVCLLPAGVKELEDEVSDIKDEAEEESFQSTPSRRCPQPLSSCSLLSAENMSLEELPWQQPIDFQDLVRRMCEAEKQMKQEKNELPVETPEHEKLQGWREKFGSKWGQVLEEMAAHESRPNYRGVFKVGDDVFPIDPDQEIPGTYLRSDGTHDRNRQRTSLSKKRGPKREELGSWKPWPVWKPSVGQTESPFADGSLKWLNDQFPVDTRKRSVPSPVIHTRPLMADQDYVDPHLGFGYCERKKKLEAIIHPDEHFFLETQDSAV